MINWQYYPKSDLIPDHLKNVVKVFESENQNIDSSQFQLNSDGVLENVRPELEKLEYVVGKNGTLEKYFEADGLNSKTKTVIEVEAGRGVTNHQFLKDLFQACMMHNVDYLIIAVRNIYRTSKDFDKVISFLDTLYASDRLKLPLKGILIIGY